MPRQIPRFDQRLAIQAQLAIGLVRAGERARALGGAIAKQEWTISRLEWLHELAYLRVFAAWEMTLEAVFCRSLCGYVSNVGQETLVAGLVPGGGHYSTLAAAEAAMLEGQQFKLWHDPTKVITRCQRFFMSGPGYPAAIQTTISSDMARLTHFANIRHRIAHDQKDAKAKFDAATVALTGHTYPASRPGRFLRDKDVSTNPPRRWLDVVVLELVSLANQIV